jgi:hypothetical protein
MSFRGVGQSTLAPGFQVRWGVIFGAAFGDVGPQYVGAHPENPGSSLVAFDESKGGGFVYAYDATFLNDGQLTTAFSMEGGGFENQFNIFGGTLSVGFENRVRLYIIYGNGEDHGAQYIAGDPELTNSSLGNEIIDFDQSKELTVNGAFDYGVTLWNSGTFTTDFALQGGQVANQFTGSEVFTLAPGAQAGFITTFGNGDDNGPMFITAHPGNPGSDLVASGETKIRTLDNRIQYAETITNIGAFPTTFHIQGGNFA